jgi:hypothetical protein
VLILLNWFFLYVNPFISIILIHTRLHPPLLRQLLLQLLVQVSTFICDTITAICIVTDFLYNFFPQSSLTRSAAAKSNPFLNKVAE